MDEQTYLRRLRVRMWNLMGQAEGSPELHELMYEYLSTIEMINSREATALWTDAADRVWGKGGATDAEESGW